MKPTRQSAKSSAAAHVRVLDESNGSCDRRKFLKALTAQGLAVPGTLLLLNSEARAHNAGQAYGDQRPGALRAATLAGRRTIIRDFADPYLELVRLLHQASEVEHALMVQYLYAGFSLKPDYAAVAGNGAPGSNDLLGIAVMEMQHLRQVNELLMAIGGSPNLFRQDFPYEPEVYPFKFQMEPLSRHSLAKYVYTEAATGSLDPINAKSTADRDFLKRLDHALGPGLRPNHVGSLYDALIHTLGEYIEHSKAPSLSPWVGKLQVIKQEGEDGHFKFFKKLFSGTHESFRRHPDIWSLSRNDPAYPAYQLPVNPSAFIGHENQLKDPVTQSLAWLGNLHYWLILLMADAAFSEKSAEFSALARTQMMGPFMSVARHLPKLGAGIPCEPLCMGYSPNSTPTTRVNFISCMVHEANAAAHRLKDRLPSDYPLAVAQHSLSVLSGMSTNHAAGDRGTTRNKRPVTGTS